MPRTAPATGIDSCDVPVGVSCSRSTPLTIVTVDEIGSSNGVSAPSWGYTPVGSTARSRERGSRAEGSLKAPAKSLSAFNVAMA